MDLVTSASYIVDTAIQETPHFQQPSAPVSTMSQQSGSDSANSGGTNKRRATPAKTPRKKAESPTPRATKEKKTNANGDGVEKKPRAPRKRSTKKADPKGVGPNGATPAQGKFDIRHRLSWRERIYR